MPEGAILAPKNMLKGANDRSKNIQKGANGSRIQNGIKFRPSMYANECALKHAKGYENGTILIKDCGEYQEGYGYIVDAEVDTTSEVKENE